ncbi:MAG: PilZ domain-containing protein [Rhodocyclales bacterium]|nr:PilZ domain-containing protein [Rhodocyclales bacterium]MBI5784441.1 PilZ domain-containing protein [Rhodocyclales bacterium]
MNDPDDRRRFWRAAFQADVWLLHESGDIPAELIDISLRGALIKVPLHWVGRIDDPCRLELTLADDAVIAMDAVVTHIEAEQVGLHCENIDLDSITHLRRLVLLNAGDADLLDRELAALRS